LGGGGKRWGRDTGGNVSSHRRGGLVLATFVKGRLSGSFKKKAVPVKGKRTHRVGAGVKGRGGKRTE